MSRGTFYKYYCSKDIYMVWTSIKYRLKPLDNKNLRVDSYRRTQKRINITKAIKEKNSEDDKRRIRKKWKTKTAVLTQYFYQSCELVESIEIIADTKTNIGHKLISRSFNFCIT